MYRKEEGIKFVSCVSENLYGYFGEKDMQYQKNREVRVKKRTEEAMVKSVLKAYKVINFTLVLSSARV